MILVTGAASLTGKKLVAELVNTGKKVRCLDTEKPKDLPQGTEFLQGTVLDEDLLKKACAGITAIFHLMDVKGAGKTGRRFMKKLNITGTGKLLRAAKKADIKRFIFMSSYEIYGNTKKMPTRYDDRKKPVTKYGKDKLKAEKICWHFAAEHEMDITIFRPTVIVGPGTSNPTILLTLYMAMAMDSANRLYVAGHGDTRFQLLHPDDAVSALIFALENDNAIGKIYNLGSDNVMSQIEQIVQVKREAKLDCAIKNLSPFRTRFMSLLLKPFKIHYLNRQHIIYLTRNLILDCQRAKTELGWEPDYDNIAIIMETIKWYEKEKL